MSDHPKPVAPSPTTLRRPPAPPRRWATVTSLGGGGTTMKPGTAPMSMVQGTLALDLRGCTGMPKTPELRVVDDSGRAVDDVEAWAARFAQAVVEVLGGDRPLTQLVRWTTSRVYADLRDRVRIIGRTLPASQRQRTIRPQVRSVRVFQPTPDTAEVSVHVRNGRRSRALAARLELEAEHWQCTALELG